MVQTTGTTSVSHAIRWCIDSAGRIQFSGLSPDTLTWKLATEVAFACTGDRPRGHSFRTDQLTDLFEQLVTSLHRLPAAPVPYIQQSSEPDFFADAHVQIIVGLSGAGKTAWVAQSALHSRHTVYLDAGSTLPTALASAVAREVAAHFLHHGDDRARDAILPGGSGLEALTALSAFAADSGRNVRLVCDNVHSIGVEALRRLVENAPSFNWALVARPSPDVASLETYFGVRAAHLGGFSLEAVAQVFSAHGCPLDVPTAAAIREISAGLPLFVKDAARLTERTYRGDPQGFVAAVRAGTHTQTTGQEVILSEVMRALSPSAQVAAALLSLSEVQLGHEECLQFVADATGDQSSTVAAWCRELVDWGVAQRYFDGSITLHERRSTRIRHATPWLKTALVQAAWAATRKNGSYLQAQFRRLKGRRGPKKAIVAVAASMLTAAYFMLRDEKDYHDLGGRYLANRDKQRVTQSLLRRLRNLGVEVEVKAA